MKVRFDIGTSLLVAGVLLLVGGTALFKRSGHIDELSWLALALAVIVAAAKIGGDLAARFGQPAVLGELLAGVTLGNLPGLQRVQSMGADGHLDMLARLGMRVAQRGFASMVALCSTPPATLRWSRS